MNAPTTGSAGRTLSAVAPTGQVEVDGVAYQAETSMFGADPGRPPIPAGRAVVVSGWRTDGEHGVVLLVSDPTAPAAGPRPSDAGPAASAPPASPPAPSYQAVRQEERIRSLERQLASRPEAGNALRTIFLFACLGLAAGLLFSCATYRGPGLVINPFAFLLWAAGGALVGVIVHLARGSGGGSY